MFYLMGSTYFACLCCQFHFQAVYYIPSIRGSLARGKLYSKVSNLICKIRDLGGCTKSRTIPAADCDVNSWDFAEDGKSDTAL